MYSVPVITTIFFDFDGVLTKDTTGSFTTCTNLQKQLPDVPLETIRAAYRQQKELFYTGRMELNAMWEHFCRFVQADLPLSVLLDAWRNVPVNEEMTALCRRLKPRYRLGIITDNCRERMEIVGKELHLQDLFNPLIVSANVGAMKREEEIFRKALDAAEARPNECIFIDNTAANLIVPAQLGMQTIFHDDALNDVEGLEENLKRMGVAAS
jgi:putative hydrolase of the HAD superfamily